nr:glycosyl hydrolase 108 family protein [uncultured Sphingomonas sp.]
MADLSTVQARVPQRDAKVNRRAGVLPERRNTDNGDFRPQAEMRTARLGDGGAADELRAIFGGLQKTAESFQTYANTKQTKQDEQDGAQGQIDSLTGSEDPELAAKSNAYRTAFSKGKHERETLTFIDTVSEEAEAFLNNPDDPATPEEFDEFLHGRLQEYLRPDGKQRDFGSPEASALTFQHLREFSAKLRSGAVDKIKQQVATESLNNAADNVRLRLKQGLPVTLQEFNDQLIDTVDGPKAQEAFLGAVQGVVEEIKFDDPERAISILRMVEGDVAAASGQTASRDDAAAERAILAGDPDAPPPPPPPPPMSKDQLTNFIADQLEGGDEVVDLGDGAGLTKFGVTAKWNPGVDIKNLTKAQATKILKDKYWSPAFDAADPLVAAIAFDASITGGSAGKNILAKANDDPETALALYRARLNWVADNVPGKAQFKQGWNNRINRLAAKLGLSGVGGVDAGIVDIPIVEGSIPRAPSRADMAEQAPLDGSVPSLSGLTAAPRGFTLSQEQRNRLRQYRVSVLKEIREEDTRKTKERQDEGARALLGRFIGIGGPKPTVADIQEAVKRGDIDPETGYQTVQRLESDAREDRSEERQARAEAREDRNELREIKRERMERRSNDFLAPVLAGRKPISEATAELLARSNAISDPEERNEFRASVYKELSALGQLRTESAPYQDYMTRMDDLGRDLKGMIDPRIRGTVRNKIEADIDAGIKRAVVRGGKMGQDQGADLSKFGEEMEKTLVEAFRKRGYNTSTPNVR